MYKCKTIRRSSRPYKIYIFLFDGRLAMFVHLNVEISVIMKTSNTKWDMKPIAYDSFANLFLFLFLSENTERAGSPCAR